MTNERVKVELKHDIRPHVQFCEKCKCLIGFIIGAVPSQKQTGRGGEHYAPPSQFFSF